MPGSIRFTFNEADDFEAALRDDGLLRLVTTGPGQFRARLTQIALPRLRLSAAEEQLPRIAVMLPPAETVLACWTNHSGDPPIWGGITVPPGQIVTLGAGRLVHIRSNGPCRWSRLRLSPELLAQYGRALTGVVPAVSPALHRWLTPALRFRQLSELHDAAIRTTQGRMGASIGNAAAHGLEQQVMHALMDCLSTGPEPEPAALRRRLDLMARFEALIQGRLDRELPVSAMCTALGVSPRLLHLCCEQHLGISPAGYFRLCRMQRVHRTLRYAAPGTTSVAAVAHRHGFHEHGRFARNYFTCFGEFPSATLRRAPDQLMAGHAPRHCFDRNDPAKSR